MSPVSQSQNIAPKALKEAATIAKGAKAEATDVESLLEGADFANELAASMSGPELTPVEISPDQLLQDPTSLLNTTVPQPGNLEGVNPKIFDPSVTSGVEKLIGPKSTEVQLTNEQVLQLANGEVAEVKGELAQVMMKEQSAAATGTGAAPAPSAAPGRAPAIDFAQGEVDPKLMNFEDFVAQKNIVTKKPLPANGYGMNALHANKQVALESGLKQTEVVKGTSSAAEGSSMNSQQFILNMMSEQGAPKLNETQAPVKIFDMSQIKTDNPNQIMTQITDYIVQAKAAKEPTVNMRVSHDELGMIDITVTKAGTPMNHDAVAINIGTHSMDGKNFFQHNSKDLFAHLNNMGINVADFKVETPSQSAKSDFDMGGQQRHSEHSGKQFGSEQNQRRHEAERRQDLWSLLRDKDAA